MKILYREPLSRHTTFRIGGPAEFLAEPANAAEARELLARARRRRLPVLVLGQGSNLLVGDRGFPGLVLKTAGLGGLELRDGRLTAGAGVRLAELLGFCLARGLGGPECLAGIPGSLGGALAMNAGTAAGCAGDLVLRIRGIGRDLRETVLERGEIDFRYRASSLGRLLVVTGAELAVRPGCDSAALKAAIAAAVGHRRASQPLGQPSAGSVFRNPPGDFAGRLVERAGCRGWRLGAAEVSTRHANFIVNCGGARATDVLGLAARVRDRVEAVSGIRLEFEIRVVGA